MNVHSMTFHVSGRNPRRGVVDSGSFTLDGTRYRWDRTSCCYWVRLRPPAQYRDFRQKQISDDVWLVLGRRPDGALEAQAVRFDVGRRFQTLDDVKAWIRRYRDRLRPNPSPTLEIALVRRGQDYVVTVYDHASGRTIEERKVPRRHLKMAADIYRRRREDDGRAVLAYEEYAIFRS